MLLDDGFLVICKVNSKALNKKEGYTGHFVVLYNYDDSYFYMHDPGLPPQEARKVPYEAFRKAWEHPDASARNFQAFKFKQVNSSE